MPDYDDDGGSCDDGEERNGLQCDTCGSLEASKLESGEAICSDCFQDMIDDY